MKKFVISTILVITVLMLSVSPVLAAKPIPSHWKVCDKELIGEGYVTNCHVHIYKIYRGYAIAAFRFDIDSGSEQVNRELTFVYKNETGQPRVIAQSTAKPTTYQGGCYYQWRSWAGGSWYTPLLKDGGSYTVWLTDSDGNTSPVCKFRVDRS